MNKPLTQKTMTQENVGSIAHLSPRALAIARSTCVLILTGILALAQTVGAANILVNPLFDATPATSGWTTFGAAGVPNTSDTYYNQGACPKDATAENVSAYPPGNTNVGNMYGNFNATLNYSGFVQTFPAAPGSTWSAGGWTYASHEDMPGPNNFFYQINFSDVGGNLLQSFQSYVVSNLSCTNVGPFPLDTWVYLGVTNQVSVANNNATSTIISNFPGGVFTAPVGTASVKFTALFVNVNYAGGSYYFDDVSLNQLSGFTPPTMSAISPNLITLCTNTALTCTATSSVSIITNVQVTTRTSVLGGKAITTNVYSLSSPKLTVTGLNTAVVGISFALSSNVVYNSVVVQVTDANNVNAAGSSTFDTISPTLVIESADFNFSQGGFIDTPANGGLGLYAGKVGAQGTDENKNPNNTNTKNYRTLDAVIIQNAAPPSGGTGIEQKFATAAASGDTNANDITEYEVGYNGVGDWLDYSRTYGAGGSAPSGTYNIWCYLATDGSGVNSTISQVTSDPTQQNQTTTVLGNIGTPSFSDAGWNSYVYVPMVDTFGNPVSVTLSNGVQTLRATVVGNPNIGFYMLMPVTPILHPILQNAYPTGAHPFEPTNKLSVTVGPANGAPLTTAGIQLVLNGADVTSQATITPAGQGYNITYPLNLNAVYSGVLNVTNTSAVAASFPMNFDTFNETNFQWEAADYDYSTNNGTIWIGGQYIDYAVPSCDVTPPAGGTLPAGELATNSYCDYPAAFTPGVDQFGLGAIAQQGIDISFGSAGQPPNPYRPPDGVGVQPASDYVRQQFVAAQTQFGDVNIGPFNLGYFGLNFWLNYTRDIPTNYYQIWGRLAGGNGAFSGTTISTVTSGLGTSNQTTALLGGFSDPNAAGWQAWHWIPLTDANGNTVVAKLGGKTTLRLTSGNNVNPEFFMLVKSLPPVTLSATVTSGQINVSIPTVTGYTYTLYFSGTLPGSSWTPVGSPITGDGTIHVVSQAAGGTSGYYRVSVHQ
jgi:hypothetical protein